MARKMTYATVASMVLCAGVFSTGFISPAMASVLKNVPFVGSVFEKSDSTDEGLRLASKTGHATAINQTVSDQDLNITVTEMINDGVRLSIAAVFELPEGADPSLGIQGFTYSLPDRENIRVSNGFWKWSHLNGNKYSGIVNIPVDSLPEEYKLKMTFDKVGSVEGNWAFEIPVIRTAETLATQSFDVNQKQTLNDTTTIDFQRVNLAPSAFSFEFAMTGPEVEKWIQNEVGSVKVHSAPDMEAYDEHGKKLEQNTNYIHNNAGDMIDVKYVFNPLKQMPKTLTLKMKEYRSGFHRDAPPTVMEFTVDVPQQPKK